MNTTFRQKGYVRNYYDFGQSNYKNPRNKKPKVLQYFRDA